MIFSASFLPSTATTISPVTQSEREVQRLAESKLSYNMDIHMNRNLVWNRVEGNKDQADYLH